MTTTRLDHLSVTNFRLFQTFEVDLHPELTVLVAANGAGKTAVLDALAVALRYFVDSMMESSTSHGFEKTDVRLALTEEGAMVPVLPTALEAIGLFGGLPTHWRRALRSMTGRTSYAEASELGARASEYLRHLRDYADRRRSDAPVLPVLAYYGTGRLWSQGKRSSSRKQAKATSFNRPLDAYLDALEPSSNYQSFKLWFKATSYEQSRELELALHPRAQLALSTVRDATNRVLQEVDWKNLAWNFSADDLVAKHPRLGELSVSLQSDGIRNSIAMVADLAHRCVRLNPQLGVDAHRRTPGIVLIDEVELHLHPAWQQSIVGLLRDAFPAVQFILTTHSPQVLSTVPAESIRILSPASWDATRTPGQQTKGVSSAEVLATVRGVDPFPALAEVPRNRSRPF
ncbi:MAG: AAA family ATPase [Myxococcota bacterium]|jgi:predicted ATP-binding protein involved in virulence|nr:AAA family ATPase [Myxococcota bacterium]